MSIDRKILVFISGAYTSGDACQNVRRHARAFRELLLHGNYLPISPVVTGHMVELVAGSADYELWMEYDLNLLQECDVVFRLPGTSAGADRECDLARRLGIPIVSEYQELDDVYELITNENEEDDDDERNDWDDLAWINN